MNLKYYYFALLFKINLELIVINYLYPLLFYNIIPVKIREFD